MINGSSVGNAMGKEIRDSKGEEYGDWQILMALKSTVCTCI